MMWLLDYLPTLAMLLLSLALLAHVAGQRRLRRQIRELGDLWSQERDLHASTRGDLRALCTSTVAMGERMMHLDQRFRDVKQRQEQLELVDHGERPYNLAIRLIRQGAGVEEVVSTCELTASEAELLVLMHRMEGGARSPRTAH